MLYHGFGICKKKSFESYQRTAPEPLNSISWLLTSYPSGGAGTSGVCRESQAALWEGQGNEMPHLPCKLRHLSSCTASPRTKGAFPKGTLNDERDLLPKGIWEACWAVNPHTATMGPRGPGTCEPITRKQSAVFYA